jgi:hypothetical protein
MWPHQRARKNHISPFADFSLIFFLRWQRPELAAAKLQRLVRMRASDGMLSTWMCLISDGLIAEWAMDSMGLIGGSDILEQQRFSDGLQDDSLFLILDSSGYGAFYRRLSKESLALCTRLCKSWERSWVSCSITRPWTLYTSTERLQMAGPCRAWALAIFSLIKYSWWWLRCGHGL